MLEKIYKKVWTSETKKICRYILKPAYVTVIVGVISLLVALIALLLTGNFISFIIASDIKYNSPSIHYLIIGLLLYAIFTLMYGVSLCLYKYHRQRKREGTSYKALGGLCEENNK